MSDFIDNGEPTAIPVGVNPYNTHGLATQGFVWAAISSVSGIFDGRVKTVNGFLPDDVGNVNVSSIRIEDYSGDVTEIRADLTVLSGDSEYRLLTNVDYDELHKYTDDKIEEISSISKKFIDVISEASGGWDNAQAEIESLSADAHSVYTSVNSASAGWNNAQTEIESLSADAHSVYTSVNSASGDWDNAQTEIETLSADAHSVYTSVNSASGGWDNAQAEIESLSADAHSVYTSVNSASGDWDNAQSEIETLSADAHSVYTSVSSASGGWNNAQAEIESLSADAHSVYTSVNSASAGWNNAQTEIESSSADWNNAQTEIESISANAHSVYTSVNSASGGWNNAQTEIETLSADAHSVYTSVNSTSGNWDSVYSSVNAVSSDWSNSTAVTSMTANWNTSISEITTWKDNVNSKIPAQLWINGNEFADKNFVNSSIATETATFRGSFNLWLSWHMPLNSSQKDIENKLDSLQPTLGGENNDYVFVEIPHDIEEPTVFEKIERYKCVEGTEEIGGEVVKTYTWHYEWTINNSSFTAEQWAAINSGITKPLVEKIGIEATKLHPFKGSGVEFISGDCGIYSTNTRKIEDTVWYRTGSNPGTYVYNGDSETPYRWYFSKFQYTLVYNRDNGDVTSDRGTVLGHIEKKSGTDEYPDPATDDLGSFTYTGGGSPITFTFGRSIVKVDSVVKTSEMSTLTGAIEKDISDHVNDTDNPHGVTASQVGAVALTGDTMTGTLTATEGITVSGGELVVGQSSDFRLNKPLVKSGYGASEITVNLPKNSGTFALAAASGYQDNLALLDNYGNPSNSNIPSNDIDVLRCSMWYPDGSVTSPTEWTPAWDGNTGIKYEFYNGTAEVLPFCSDGESNAHLSGRVVIPPYVDHEGARYTVTGIKNGSYYVQTNTTEIIAPTTVTYVGSNAFDGCQALTTVYMPGVEDVWNLAFSSCTSLKNVELPNADSISNDNGTFYLCGKLKYISLESITDIGDWTFNGCSSLSVVNFGKRSHDSIPSIGENAFAGVPTSCMFVIPDEQYDEWKSAQNWSTLYSRGFRFLKYSDWEYARKYEVNDKFDPLLFAQYYPDGSVKSAAEFTSDIKYDTPNTSNRTITAKPFCNTNGTATNDNSGLKGSVVIPPFVDAQGNPYISDDGTRYRVVGVSSKSGSVGTNTNLTAIVAPNTVTNTGGNTFAYCLALTTVSFPAATTAGDAAFYGCSSLTSVLLPAATSIENNAFVDCASLSSVSFPAATSIGDGAFTRCTPLTSVDFGDTPRSSVPTLGVNAFNGVPDDCTITVPYVQYDAWKAASGWKDLPQEFVRHTEKADKPATFTIGNLAKFDIDGNLVDAEISTDEIVTESEFAPVANREFLMISSDRTVALAKDAVESAYPISTRHDSNSADYSCYGFSLNLKTYLEEIADSGDISITKVRLQSITTRLRNSTSFSAKIAVKETGTSTVLALSEPVQLTSTGMSGRSVTFLFTDGVILDADKRYDFAIVDATTGSALTGLRFGASAEPVITGLVLLNNDGTRSSHTGSWGGGMAVDCIGLASVRIATEAELSDVSAEKLDSDVVDAAYDKTHAYIVGETCTHEGKWYRCTTATAVNEDWTPAHWEKMETVAEILEDDIYPSLTVVKYNDGTSAKLAISGEIGENTIPNKQNAVKVKVGNTVTSIGASAFYACTNITRVVIPDSVSSIGNNAFYDCTSLSDLRLGGNIESIGEYAFNYCISLRKFVVPSSVASIGNNAFNANSDMTVVFDGKTLGYVRSMGNYPWAVDASKIHAIDTESIEKTWSELVALRDGGKLTPGQQYRITDYVATTNGDMGSRSANHPFDIIVTADDERTLNEHARAVIHEGDLPDDIVDGSTRTKYFAGCDLAAWDVWYCLDNDTNRFAWAVANGGKGVVYHLVDEFQNDVPYDFKGIQFKAYGDTDNVYRYTFDSGDASNNTDLSKSGLNQHVHDNTISSYADSKKWTLNCIVFKGSICTYNTFGPGCSHNTFGPGCSYNTFGSSCSYNTFGPRYTYNTFGSSCSYNTFGSSCSYNTFGSYCYSITFGSYCYSNTFGSNCCIGSWSNSSQWYVGTVVKHNNVLHAVLRRYRGSFFTSQTYLVGETLYRQAKYWECTTEHSGSWNAEHFTEIQLVGGILSAEEYVPLSYYRYIELEDGVSYVALDCTANRGNANYQNVTVSKGIAGTASAPKHIEDANYSQTYKTTYQPANSNVISI